MNLGNDLIQKITTTIALVYDRQVELPETGGSLIVKEDIRRQIVKGTIPL